MTFPLNIPPATPEGERALALFERATKLAAAAKDVRDESAAALALPARVEAELEDELARAAADGQKTTPTADKLARDLAKARDAATEPHDVRINAANRAARQAQAEFEGFVAEHVPELLDELRPEAEAARQRIIDAAAELEDALAGWHAVAGRVGAISNRSPHLLRSVPPLADETLVNSVRGGLQRLSAKVNLPLPADRYMAHYLHLTRGETADAA